MKQIKILTEQKLENNFKPEQLKEVNILLNQDSSKVIEITLSRKAILTKHSSKTPITVLCLAGTGIFRAGENLDEEQKLTAGTLIYLDKDIEHEVIAEPNIKILVTKFSS